MSAFCIVESVPMGAEFQADYVVALERRVAALEDCLQELEPFATCERLDMTAHFKAENDEMARAKGHNFKRDTLYIDQRIFRKVAKLLRHKIVRA